MSTGKPMPEQGIKWGGKTFIYLDYSDDLSILDESVSKMNELQEILQIRGSRISLKIIVKKTKLLSLGLVTLGYQKTYEVRFIKVASLT